MRSSHTQKVHRCQSISWGYHDDVQYYYIVMLQSQCALQICRSFVVECGELCRQMSKLVSVKSLIEPVPIDWKVELTDMDGHQRE